MNAPIPYFSLFFWNNETVTKQTLSYELLINHIRFIQEGGLKELNFFTTIMPNGSWIRVYRDPTEVTLQQYGQFANLPYYYYPSLHYTSAELLEMEYVSETD